VIPSDVVKLSLVVVVAFEVAELREAFVDENVEVTFANDVVVAVVVVEVEFIVVILKVVEVVAVPEVVVDD
jgi:hypothetical protein